jgi:crossover junction endodeoxyribonuclease RusA
MDNVLAFYLPWPPNVNHYWRAIGRGRVVLSREGRTYREVAGWELLSQCARNGFGKARVRVEITAYPPDRRRRDLDNLLKAPLDVCRHIGLYADDEQIDELRVVRGVIVPGGRLRVVVERMEQTAPDASAGHGVSKGQGDRAGSKRRPGD